MPNIPWDPEQPPVDPPGGSDPLLWRLSHQLRKDHSQIDVDGFCAACRTFSPCQPRRLAERGLILAWERHKPPPNAATARYDRSVRAEPGWLGIELRSGPHAPAVSEAHPQQEPCEVRPAPPPCGIDRGNSQKNHDSVDE